MHTYRLYTYDREGHPIGPALPISGEDDAHAVEQARKRLNSHYAELYDELRLVEKFEPKSPPKA